MDDRDSLFANVLEQPADDAARLVLADWLEENGEESLGRFIRAGVVASRFRGEGPVGDDAFHAALGDIAAVAQAGGPARWVAALGLDPTPPGDWVWDNAGDRVTVRVGACAGVFTRGLLSELLAPLEVCYEAAPAAFARWPLERVGVADLPGLNFWVHPPGEGRAAWGVSAGVTAQPRRPRRGVLRQLASVLGLGMAGDDPPPVPPRRWTAERAFASRADLAASLREAMAALYDEVRGAAGPQWNPPA